MKRSFLSFLDKSAYGLTLLFALDRLLKMAAVIHFFRRPQPPPPPSWPEVTLLQPITRGTSNLLDSLQTRARLDYPATVQHLLICDANDVETRATVSLYLAEFQTLQAEVLLIESSGGAGGAGGVEVHLFRQPARARGGGREHALPSLQRDGDQAGEFSGD